MPKLILVKPIPAQAINEAAAFGPFDLKTFIQSEDEDFIQFNAELKSGASLPKGLILTSDGLLTGIPAKDTQGLYEVVVTAESGEDQLKTAFQLTIQPGFANKETEYLDKLKAQVWEALEQNLPLPELSGLLSLPISKLDIYYLLERWGTLTIWDAFNLDPAGEKILLNVEGASPHYNIYDRGSSLIMAPKDLFSFERTTLDGIQTAKALAREIYKRGWTIEMAGLDKWTHTAWLEFQILGDKHGKHLEIINYQPSPEELHAYTVQSWNTPLNAPE